MEILNDSKKKVEIDYPCTWKYKLIGYEKEAIQKALYEVILGREHNLVHSKASKNGKYVSMNLDLLVHNEDDRNFIYEALKKHSDLKMVL